LTRITGGAAWPPFFFCSGRLTKKAPLRRLPQRCFCHEKSGISPVLLAFLDFQIIKGKSAYEDKEQGQCDVEAHICPPLLYP
jgi:hypothetical protein